MAELTAFSAAQAEALARWLAHLSALDGASEKTVQAYGRDLRGFLAFLSQHHGAGEGLGALDALHHTDLRAWMAAERGRGLSARSLARSLSAVKNFLGWLSQQHGFDATTALSARSPKFRRKLPRPLTVEGAQEVLSDIGIYAAQDWIGVRDTAVVTLLYGCGLRISEALGLTGAAHPLPEVLRIRGKGDKDRLVPVLPVARAAVAEYLRLCPYPVEKDAPLFRGARGGALNPRLIAKAMDQTRLRLGLPATATPHARLALDHASLYRRRCRPPDGGLRTIPSAGT